MEPVGRVGPATIVGSPHGTSREIAESAPHSTRRALVPLAPVGAARSHPSRTAACRANAAFLAHLIATVQGAPQTRERRRADPDRATMTYAAAMQVDETAGRDVRVSR